MLNRTLSGAEPDAPSRQLSAPQYLSIATRDRALPELLPVAPAPADAFDAGGGRAESGWHTGKLRYVLESRSSKSRQTGEISCSARTCYSCVASRNIRLEVGTNKTGVWICVTVCPQPRSCCNSPTKCGESIQKPSFSACSTTPILTRLELSSRKATCLLRKCSLSIMAPQIIRLRTLAPWIHNVAGAEKMQVDSGQFDIVKNGSLKSRRRKTRIVVHELAASECQSLSSNGSSFLSARSKF